jgi:hypothetical protein
MLLHGTTDESDRFHDIYAIGLQEIAELGIVNICFSSAETENSLQQWSDLLLGILNAAEGGSGDGFSLLGKIAVVGTGLIILVKNKHFHSNAVDRARVISTSLNLGKLYTGNKAAVSIRARVANTTMCFVSVHFAAHRGKAASEERAEHLLYTMKHLMFPGVEYDEGEEVAGGRRGGGGGGGGGGVAAVAAAVEANLDAPLLDGASHSSSANPQSLGQPPKLLATVSSLDVSDHDFVVLLGDLNSRMREEISEKDVWELIDKRGRDSATPPSSEDIVTMQSWDELWSGPMSPILRHLGLREGTVTFGPTYKLELGSSTYHVPPAEKPNKVFNHCPAWCDRILWSHRPSGTVCEQVVYDANQVLLSDHLPVYTVFRVSSSGDGSGDAAAAAVAAVAGNGGSGGVNNQQDAAKRRKALRFARSAVHSRSCFSGDEDCAIQ